MTALIAILAVVIRLVIAVVGVVARGSLVLVRFFNVRFCII